MTLIQRLQLSIPIIAVSIGIDQWTKLIATETLKNTPTQTFWGDTFRLQWTTNEGAFLSLGASLPPHLRHWILTIAVGVLLLGLVIYVLVHKELDAFQVGSYALIASGGLSNWIDRARFDGSVVDFMNLGIGWLRTGVFNVADVAIMVGIGLLFLHSWRADRHKRAGHVN